MRPASPGAPLVYRPIAPAAGTGFRIVSGRLSPSERRYSVPAGVGCQTPADSERELIVRADIRPPGAAQALRGGQGEEP